MQPNSDLADLLLAMLVKPRVILIRLFFSEGFMGRGLCCFPSVTAFFILGGQIKAH